MRSTLVVAMLAIGVPALAWAGDAPAPWEVGVHIQKPAGDGVHFAQGQGIYLSGGLVLTAAHVVNWDPDHPEVTIRIDGGLTKGEIVFDSVLKDTDLAVVALSPDELSAKRREQASVPVCPDNTPPSQSVVVVAERDITNAATIPSPISTIGEGGNWTNVLSRDYAPGNSGSGVFDPIQHCLWGIIVDELGGKLPSGLEVHWSYFVPVSKIAPFLDGFLKRKSPIDGGPP